MPPAWPPEPWTSVWSGGTLFPLSSKKLARAINAFSGALPLVILANLSGFDASPESLRKLQLEYGAEIGRAVVNFRGPIVFVVTARYHGGARYRKEFDELYQMVYAEKQSALAQAFDSIHSVERACEVGSIDDIITLAELRPYLVRKVDEGMKRFYPPGSR